MSDTIKPAHHGWDHAPGGEDPIETLTYPWARFERVSGTDISVTDDVSTQVTGNTHSTTDVTLLAADDSSITVKRDGLYSILAQTSWSGYNTTWRSVWVLVNTDHHIVQGGSSSDFDDFPMAAGDRRLSANDSLSLWVHQHSGGAQTIYGGGSGSPDGWDTNWLEVRFLGPVQ